MLHYTSQPSSVRKTTEITVSRRVAVGHEREAVIRLFVISASCKVNCEVDYTSVV